MSLGYKFQVARGEVLTPVNYLGTPFLVARIFSDVQAHDKGRGDTGKGGK